MSFNLFDFGDEIFVSFQKVDKSRQVEWDERLSKVQTELSNDAATYIYEERARSARVAELSRLKMLG